MDIEDVNSVFLCEVIRLKKLFAPSFSYTEKTERSYWNINYLCHYRDIIDQSVNDDW